MRIIYKTFLILFLFTISISDCYSQSWIEQPSPTTKWLNKCFFADTLNGWAGGDSGVIIHTSNGGQNWFLQHSNDNYFILDIFFINKNKGWAVSNGFTEGRILKTTNGGNNWVSASYPDLYFNTIYFVDSANGYMGAYGPNNLLKTTDGGNNWFQTQFDTNSNGRLFPIRKFNFYNQQFGFACGGYFNYGGVIWKTSNYGYNWILYNVAPEPIFDIKYIDYNRLIGIGGDFAYGASVVRSLNGGNNWNYYSLNILGIGHTLAFRTLSEIWVPLGFAQKWAVSLDTGNTWFTVNTTDSAQIYDATFKSFNHGWAVGNNGKILKYNDQIVNASNLNHNTPDKYYLYQNYPNPFNPSTMIKFEIPKDSYTELKIYDILGKEITTIINKQLKPGTYEVEWFATDYPSGTYFYKIITDNFSETKRMVLVK